MNRVCSGLPTKSAKIRALAQAGYPRADIARHLGIRYQHVRNVLERPTVAATANKTKAAEEISGTIAWAQIGPDGRVVIPAAFRHKLGLGDDGCVLMRMEGGELRLVGRDAAIARAQALVAKYVPKGVSLVGELLADRRREAAREEGRG
jgi:bifunctional DNA-binding transcriptional regulator/antitoxin component of YhaV-PrlF toxin-antitoxin module